VGDKLVLVRPEVRLNGFYVVGVTFRIRQSYDRSLIPTFIPSSTIITVSVAVAVAVAVAGLSIATIIRGSIIPASTIIPTTSVISPTGVVSYTGIVPSPGITRIQPRIVTGILASILTGIHFRRRRPTPHNDQ
jgi:hypothetical protein